MRKLICLILIFTTISRKFYYHSYLYDIDSKKPIENVEIYDVDSLVSKTDIKGYFKLY